MKALLNMLADVRTSPQAVASELMRQHPDLQETFISLSITYIAAMAGRKIYHDDVAHIVHWSKDVMKALDSMKD